MRDVGAGGFEPFTPLVSHLSGMIKLTQLVSRTSHTAAIAYHRPLKQRRCSVSDAKRRPIRQAAISIRRLVER